MSQGYHKNSAENKPSMGSLEPGRIASQIQPPPFDKISLSVEQMKAVLTSSPAGIGIVTGRILGWANENFYAMLGYEYGSLEGKNTRILSPTQWEYEKMLATLTKGMEKYGVGMVETRVSGKDGLSFDCQIRSSLLDHQSPEKGAVVVITDTSELKSLQIQLQQAQKMEAIGVLAGGISHDFNNILMGIQGHLSLMRINVNAAEKISSHIHQIGKLVNTAAELTGRLLGFARGGKYQTEILNINEVISLVLKMFKSSRKDIRIHESFEKELHLVEGDLSQMEQVLLNILINASQAMVGEGEIVVSTQNIFIQEHHQYQFEVNPGRYIQISIKDTGTGMDTNTQKKIFDPFFSTKKIGDQKGRGLGLSTVFGIVKNHSGFITVTSKKGEGSVFNVCLPASNTLPVKDLKTNTPSSK